MEYRPLADFVELSQGLAVNKGTAHLFSDKKCNEFPYPLLRIIDFENGIHDNYSKYVSRDVASSVIIDKNTIVFTRVTCQCFRGFSGVLHNNLFVVTLKNDELTDDYLFTVLQSDFVKKQALYFAQSSVVPDLNHKMFKEIRIPVPDKRTQEKIATLYLEITNKIKNNTKINVELEAMARTLYDYWFLQFDFPGETGRPYKSSGGRMVWNEELKREIPEGWRVIPIEDLCSIVDCLHSKKPEYMYEKEESYLLTLDNLSKEGYIDISRKYYISDSDYREWTKKITVSENDFVVTNAGRAGDIGRIPKGVACAIGRNMTAIRPVAISPYYLRQFFKSNYVAEQISSNLDCGSFFMSFNVKSIKKMKVIVPSESIMEMFLEKIESLVNRIDAVNEENGELTSLRDFLLPLLMNGQVGFKE